MTDVFDLAQFDPSVRPQDDLFRHVNGRWLQTAEIPADKPMAGAFVHLRDAAEEAVRDIIVGTADAPAAGGQIGDLYASFMDADRIERVGLAPLRPEVDEALGLSDADDLARWLGRAVRRGVGGAIHLGVEADPGDPGRTVLFVFQGGIGLPDEAYYREDAHAEVRAKYVPHIERMLALVGVPDPAGAAARVFALETRIAADHWDIVRCRDWQQTYNLMSREQVEGLAPGFAWPLFWDAAGVGPAAEHLVVEQPSFVEGLGTILADTPLATWREWAAWQVAVALAPYAFAALAEESFDFRGRVLQGIEQQRDRWKRGVSLVEGALGESVGRVYVERHFSPLAKQRMDRLVANLVEAYRRSIETLEWMTAETRSEALAKLAAFDPQVGYPKRWRDYGGLRIDPQDLVGNVLRSNEFDHDYQMAKLGRPIDRDEWLMTPQTVNAYYHPLRNQIVFPAAILQPPFFDAAADDAVNYGGIGSVIGHEIGHGFDDQGSQCDGEGRLRNWWTAADRTAFEERTKALIAQYDALVPEGLDVHVNGALTIGENIGDLGGVSIAYLAWRIACGDTEPVPVSGHTGAERFFFNFARIWQAKIRPEAARQRIATDPHSPNEFRCNQIVKNVPAFAETFGVAPGDGLWLDPAERVRIWS
ncbi:M13 family metallopeptidase [Propionicicella superfundia]|uniref:M13 family metallopeptidase n=1 Tax=Propionicicella superfundia TaxID=348582 RepID=UPI000405FA44|nr:M13-type metalloendopeptidase [Propionicicella superfundia]